MREGERLAPREVPDGADGHGVALAPREGRSAGHPSRPGLDAPEAQIEPASTMKLLAVHIAASSEAKKSTIRAR